MSTNREMLKEAIAEAKAVKEMAIANAKVALEEAFTPQLQSMLSAKLQEMEEEDEDVEDMDEALGTLNDPDSPTAHGNIAEEEEMDEELDLDEILSSLNEEEEEEESEEEESEEESEEEGEPLDLEDMTDDDLKSFIEDVIADMVKSGELEAGHEDESEEEEAEGESEEDMMMEEEDIDLDELLAEIDSLDISEEMEDESMMYEDELEETSNHQFEALQAELDEALNTIATLRGDLNEVNLLNAKLLYTNKIFKSKNLTESQKVTVLTTFDKATTVKEVKLVFETLTEGLKTKTNKPSRITENLGSASKSTGTTKTKRPILESDDMVKRFQKLAGINL
jgi:hypothetical protein